MKKIKKMMLFITVICMFSCVLWGCGKSEKENTEASADETASKDSGDKKIIGLVVHSLDDNYVSYLVDGFKKAVSTMDGYELMVLDSKKDVNTESQNITNLISMKASGIVLHCVDSNACENYVTMCKENEIPLITTKTLYSETQPDVNIIMDSHDAGVAQAEGLVKQMGEEGNVVILLGELGSEYTNERTAGNKEVFDKYPDIHVVTEECANWSRADAMDIIENLVQSGQEFNAVICNNDEMAIGAGLALQGQGKDLGDYYIAGIDSTPEALASIKDGVLDVTVFDNVKNLADTSVDALVKLNSGEEVESNINLQCMVVTKDNMDECQAVWDELLSE